MEAGGLGRIYQPSEVIIRQGDIGDCMYIIQEGHVEVVVMQEGREICLAIRGPGDFIGEMALFEREVRMATVRALGQARVLTIDQKNLVPRIHQDPSLAYRIIKVLCHRLRQLSAQVIQQELAGFNGTSSAAIASGSAAAGMPIRKIDSRASIVDINDEVTACEADLLMEAYQEASVGADRTVILNMTRLKYMNSAGIAVLIEILRQAKAHGLQVFAYGPNAHVQEILDVTRLGQLMPVFEHESDALDAISRP